MNRIVITGWKEGFQKVAFNQYLRAEMGLGLAEAKSIVEAILRGEVVEISAPIDAEATIRTFGLVCSVDEPDD